MAVFRYLLPAAVSAVFVASACGQAVVEHSIGTAASGAAAAGSAGASKSIGGVFRSLEQTLDKTGQSPAGKDAAPAETRSQSVSVRPSALPPAHNFRHEDLSPDQIELGTERVTLLQAFGRPFMRTARLEGSTFLEMFYYRGDGDLVVVTLREGRVSSVFPPPETPDPDTPGSPQE